MCLLPFQSTFPCTMSLTSHLAVLCCLESLLGWALSLGDLLRLSTSGLAHSESFALSGHPTEGASTVLGYSKISMNESQNFLVNIISFFKCCCQK